MSRVVLKAGRERSLLRRHPWVFSGAIGRVEGDPQPGDVVEVSAADGRFLARAGYSPSSQIRARVLAWEAVDAVDEGLLERRLSEAIAARAHLPGCGPDGAMRLVHGESDGLPGIVADRFDDTVVVQLLTAWADRQREPLARLLTRFAGCRRVHERSDADVRELEGLPPRSGTLHGPALDAPIGIVELGPPVRHYRVDAGAGQKTGFFLDQRDNRDLVAGVAAGRAVLDAFCYTGGFAIAAATGGAASVLAIDSSGPALALARANAQANGSSCAAIEWREADVFRELRRLRDQGAAFDLVVLDPPKFAPTAQHAEKASRAYKDINLLGFRLLRPGGLLFTFSCSGGVGIELFQKIVAGAALDAGVDATIVRTLCAAPDHPVLLSFPEGAYLKGLVCQRR